MAHCIFRFACNLMLLKLRDHILPSSSPLFVSPSLSFSFSAFVPCLCFQTLAFFKQIYRQHCLSSHFNSRLESSHFEKIPMNDAATESWDEKFPQSDFCESAHYLYRAVVTICVACFHWMHKHHMHITFHIFCSRFGGVVVACLRCSFLWIWTLDSLQPNNHLFELNFDGM